jgi:hypothetical protein
VYFGQGMTKICSPKWKGGPLVGKNLEQTFITLITKHVFILWKRCQQLKHGQILTLDRMGWEWNLLDTLCKKVHHTSTTKINVHKKMKKNYGYTKTYVF